MTRSGPPPATRVLIVEDEVLTAWAAKEELERAGLVVCGIAATEQQGIRLALTERPDVALVDVRLKQGCGLRAARPMAEAGVAVLFVTAHGEDLRRPEIGLGCLDKPFAVELLPEVVRLVQRFHQTGAPPADLPLGLHLSYPRRSGPVA